jgi:hypothetical protein
MLSTDEGVQMRGRCAVVLALLLIAVLALVGCGSGSGASSSKSDLEGVWNKTKTTDGSPSSGSSIKFEGDVFYTDATDLKTTHYRVVKGDKTLTLTPIVVKDQIETDDASKSRDILYTLDGDTLVLAEYGTWERAK